MAQSSFEKIRTYPDYGEYVIAGGVIIFFIVASKNIWLSIACAILLVFLLWFRVRLIRFNSDGIALVYPFRLVNRQRTYLLDEITLIQVMSEFPGIGGSPKIKFDLVDGRKIVLRYDKTEFKKMIDLIGTNNFSPKIHLGTQNLFEIAKSNSNAKVIREYVPKH